MDETAALESEIGPILDVGVDDDQGAGRQIVGQRRTVLRLSALDERQREFVQPGIVRDDDDAARARRIADLRRQQTEQFRQRVRWLEFR